MATLEISSCGGGVCGSLSGSCTTHCSYTKEYTVNNNPESCNEYGILMKQYEGSTHINDIWKCGVDYLYPTYSSHNECDGEAAEPVGSCGGAKNESSVPGYAYFIAPVAGDYDFFVDRSSRTRTVSRHTYAPSKGIETATASTRSRVRTGLARVFRYRQRT